MVRKLAAVALATSTVAIASPALAQDDGGRRPSVMGLRFEAALSRDFNLVGGVPQVTNVPSPNGDIKVGYDLAMGFTPMIGIGFATVSNNLYSETDEDELALGASDTAIVLDLELRWYFAPHRAGSTQPFVFGEFNTALTSASTDSDLEGFEENDDENEARADERDFWEINAGLGMEYKFDQSFAIGGKWGLGFGFTGTEQIDDVEDSANTSASNISTSAAIYAAWRI
jgi:hypothetical protein